MMYIRAMSALQDLRDREEGQGMVEYALILGLISVIAITAITTVGQDVKKAFEAAVTALTNV